jgi:tellurite resistance protein
VAQSLRFLPVGMYGAVMGLAGLGLACRTAELVLPLPSFVAEFWVALAVLALGLLLPAYLLKLARYPGAVREEFLHPAQLGFCATLPVGVTLVAGGLAPYAPYVAEALWWCGVVALFCLQLWALRLFLGGGIDITQVNGGWIILMVGGIVVPGSGIALGQPGASAFMFGLSATIAPFIVGVVFFRTLFYAPLPRILRPTWFVFLVPPSLIYANGAVLGGPPVGIFLNGLFYFALALAVALLIASRDFLRWPFGAPWWAFTFPLDALASASARYALAHPSDLWRGIAAAALALAGFFALVVLVKTLSGYFRGELLAAPDPAETDAPENYAKKNAYP